MRMWMKGMLCAALIAGMAAAHPASQAARSESAFAKSNLHAWAFEEYDAVTRSPAERAAMLKTLGFTRAGFVGRHVQRMGELDAYVAAYRAQQIELMAVWTPINTAAPLEEPHIRMFLEGVERHKLKLQWWVTLEQFKEAADGGQAIERAVAVLRPVVAAAAARGLRLALYGHGRDAWFTQPEQEVAIIERLHAAGATRTASVGIAYNFHHAHAQLARFAEIFPKMKPHVIAINLNGMSSAGPQILPLGEGDREQEMIAIIHKSGYRGAVGLIAHQRTMDAADVLGRNIAGLRRILMTIGDAAGASTY